MTVILYLITDKRIGKGEFKWKYFLAFISLFLLPQIPYLSVKVAEGSSLYIRNYDYGYMKYLVSKFLSQPFYTLKDLLISLDVYYWRSLMPIAIIFLFGVISYVYKMIKQEKSSFNNSILVLLVIILVPALLLYPFMSWDLNAFFLFLFLLISFVKLYDNFWPEKEMLKYILFFIIGSILITSMVLSSNANIRTLFLYSAEILPLMALTLIVTAFCFKSVFNLKKYLILTAIISISICSISSFYFFRKINRFKIALKHIYLETGWNEEIASQRIFKIGFNKKLDFLFYYKLIMEEMAFIDKKNSKNNKGYFIINGQENFLSFKKELKDHFLSHYLPDEIKKEVTKGSLVIREPYFIQPSIWFVPYNIKEYSTFPKGFHNIGKLYYEEPNWSKNVCYVPGLIKYKNTFYLCYMLINYIGEKISFLINFSKTKKTYFLQTTITGYPLIISDNQIKDFHFIKDIFIKFSCGKEVEKLKILSHIGYNINRSQKFKSFFSPIERKFPIKCKNINDVKELTVVFDHRVGYDKLKKISFSYPLKIK